VFDISFYEGMLNTHYICKVRVKRSITYYYRPFHISQQLHTIPKTSHLQHGPYIATFTPPSAHHHIHPITFTPNTFMPSYLRHRINFTTLTPPPSHHHTHVTRLLPPHLCHHIHLVTFHVISTKSPHYKPATTVTPTPHSLYTHSPH